MKTERADPRYVALRRGLEQLDDEDLKRLAEYPADRILLDGGNYAEGKFCPLCVALEVPKALGELRFVDAYLDEMEDDVVPPTNGLAQLLLAERGRRKYGPSFRFNQLHGLPGEFYRDPHRLEDLLEVLNEVMEERGLR